MFSSQKSRESTKKTKEVKIDLINKNRKQRNTQFCETKFEKLLQDCSRKKVKYEGGAQLQLVTAARDCLRMAGAQVAQQLQGRPRSAEGPQPAHSPPRWLTDGLES